jgi:fibronectin type 3 domain-containing protein
VPAGLEARATTPRQIDLQWGDATDPESGIAVYNVFRDGARVTATAGTVYSDAGRAPGTTYTYEVSAVNGAGLESGRSAPVTATTPDEADTTPPAPPGPPRIIGS